MVSDANNKIIAVFESCTEKAPRMTHALSELGDGDMGTGILNLWEAGRCNGFVQGTAVTTIAFVLGIGACKLVSAIREDRKIKRLIREANYEIYLNKRHIGGGCNYA